MRAIFRDQHRYQLYVQVEGALAAAQGRHGAIPPEAARMISERASTHRCDLEKIARSEAVTRHELVSVVDDFTETCAPYGRFVHFGVTSSDILDTALAMQLAEALDLFDTRVRDLLTALLNAIDRVGDHVVMGRTHGQHAQPITLGFKVAIWLDQIARCLKRLRELRGRAVMGKIAGAVGSMAGLSSHGEEIQRDTLLSLGLPEPEISAQAVARDRMAEFLCWAGLTAACLDNMATEIRNLQRTEIGEVAEEFFEGDQIGSSAMPHKRNPVRSERICSLARLVRSLIGPGLENVVTWHERDLANSANERFTLPEACVLLDEMLIGAASILSSLVVFPDRMRDNLTMLRNIHLSEAILLRLVEKGMERRAAYRLLQRASNRAAVEGRDLVAVVAEDPKMSGVIGEEALAAFVDLNPDPDVGRCRELAAGVVKDCERLLQGRMEP
jgi:adenylosuccinate lyase